jgi:hypothetical protein
VSFTEFFTCIQMLVKIGQCQTLYVKAFCFAFSVKSSFNKSECKHVIDVHSPQLGTQPSRVTLQRLTPNVTCGALFQECPLSPSKTWSKAASSLKYLNKRYRVFFFGRVRKTAKSDYKLRHVSLPVCLTAWNNSAPTERIFKILMIGWPCIIA